MFFFAILLTDYIKSFKLLTPVPPLATGKIPLVILEADRLGILAVLNVPDVILDAARFGILLVPNTPLMRLAWIVDVLS